MTDRVLLSSLVLAIIVETSKCDNLDVRKTVVVGPGLYSGANLPVRYVYIHSRCSKGKAIQDQGDDTFEFELNSRTGNSVQATKQILNLRNGSYLALFRVHNFGGDLRLTLTHRGKSVADSPYYLKNVYGDGCYCPMPMKEWKSALGCQSNVSRIEKDLKAFEVIDLDKLVSSGIPKFAQNYSLCHYAVKRNKIFRQCHGNITDYKIYMDELLSAISSRVQLPDLEFLINLSDDDPVESSAKENAVPIISWCGTEDTADIIVPTYDLTHSTLEMMKNVSFDVFSVQANTGPKWDEKIEKGFFRGKDSSLERLKLAAISVKNRDTIDAAITEYFSFEKNEEQQGKSVERINFFEFFKFKYQLNIDGVVAAYRFPYLLSGDALVFKQNSKYYEHFYDRFRPWVHYVPLRRDLGDVLDKIKWARENDDAARKIQKTGTELARKVLAPDQIFCYYTVLFEKYAKRQSRPVKVLKAMKEVKHRKKECGCRWSLSENLPSLYVQIT